MQPCELTATEALALIKAGELTSRELSLSCLGRIRERDADVRAWTYLDPDAAFDGASRSDAGRAGHVLEGLPVGVKDIIDVAGMPTACNSPIYAGHHPSRDAACVAMLRHAGAIMMGKTDTVEFAIAGRRASTRNPRNLAHTPGASSSGSAAAVADFMVPLAIGTQTAGSVIRPAAFTGVYAFKPSFGLVSTEGCKPCAPSFDTLGWFARCVDDLLLVAKACEARSERWGSAPATADLRTLRIGLCRTPHWHHSQPEARAALLASAGRLADEGARIVELDLPDRFDRLTEAQRLVMYHQSRASLLAEYRIHGNDLSDEVRSLIERAGTISGDEIAAAHDCIAECRAAFDALFGSAIDVVLTLAAPGSAPEGLQRTGDPIFNGLWTALQAPCLAVPAEVDANGLPVGVQLVGQRFADNGLLAIAKAAAPVIDCSAKQPQPA